MNYSGCGVFATKAFWAGDFLLEYRGELIEGAEGEQRYKDGQKGSFLYFFEDTAKSKCGN